MTSSMFPRFNSLCVYELYKKTPQKNHTLVLQKEKKPTKRVKSYGLWLFTQTNTAPTTIIGNPGKDEEKGL